eukprot:4272474-Prymnesium_polylepis.1
MKDQNATRPKTISTACSSQSSPKGIRPDRPDDSRRATCRSRARTNPHQRLLQMGDLLLVVRIVIGVVNLLLLIVVIGRERLGT